MSLLFKSILLIQLLAGCASTPTTYIMTSAETEELRSDLGTIGVTISTYPIKSTFTVPAKGWWGGMKRGFISGATTPVLIGFVAPVPGGTFLGLIVAPFTAIYGAISGARKSLSIDEVESAEAGLNHALDRLRAEDDRQTSLAEFVRLAEARTAFKFVALPAQALTHRDDYVRYSDLDQKGIDTILELRVESGGLWGMNELDPPSVAFIETRIRLIRANDNELILEDNQICLGARRKYVDWGKNNGQLFYEEILGCIPRLQEKVIEDMFLIFPLATP